MDYDALRELMVDGISDAINNVFVAWCEQQGIENGDGDFEAFASDPELNSEIISALQSAINDRS